MATSGTHSVTVTSYDTLRFSWERTSYSVNNNTSTLAWRLQLIAGAYGRISSSVAKSWSVTIDGQKFSGTTKIAISNNATITLASGTCTVNHNSDGTKSCNYSFSQVFDITFSGASVGTKSGSGTFAIDAIPRATTPTISGTLSLGSTITISTSSRASTSFTHKIYYSWGSQITDNLIASDVTTSTNFVIPQTLAEYIQGSTSGTLLIKCYTYNGSTLIGQKNVAKAVSVPNTAEYQPTIESISITDANTLPVDRFVVGKSQLIISVSAVGGYVSGSQNRNSYPVKAVVTVDGLNYSVALGQSSAKTWSITTNLLTSAGSKSGTVTVTDSRNRTVSETFSYTAYEYTAPKIHVLSATRTNEDKVVDDSGEYIRFILNTTISSIDNQNAKTYKVVYENGGNEVTLDSGTLSEYTDNRVFYYSVDDGITFSADNQWIIRAYVYDSFNSSEPAVKTVIVPTEKTFMDWRDNGNGIAFGKVSTKDGFECGWNMYDKYDMLISNGLMVYTGSGDSAIDPDTTLEHQILTNKNTPTSAFCYITTLFYSTKSVTSNRTQIAYPYADNIQYGYIYTRKYYNGSWTEWAEITTVYEAGTTGIWNYRKMTNGEVELWGSYEVSNMECNNTLGAMYRTAVFSLDAFPFNVANAKVVFSYNSNGYGAIPWATTATTALKPPDFYLIRPTSATIVSGKLNLRVIGRWK